MTHSNEIEALKASIRGARRTADQLADLATRVEALDSQADVPEPELEALRSVTLAHAVAAQAVRGLVETMLKRRGKGLQEAVGSSSGGDE